MLPHGSQATARFCTRVSLRLPLTSRISVTHAAFQDGRWLPADRDAPPFQQRSYLPDMERIIAGQADRATYCVSQSPGPTPITSQAAAVAAAAIGIEGGARPIRLGKRVC